MDFDKFPRWALVALCFVFMALSTWFGGRAIAENDKIKVVAYQAKNVAEDAYALANDLKVQIADVRGAQETFRQEYRQDQKDLDKKMSELLMAIKA